MDDQRVGVLARAIRRRLGWRQADVAARAQVAQTMVSLFERGHLDRLSLPTSRRICGALGIRLEFLPRWRGGDGDRLLDERHAAMCELALARTTRAAGWKGRPEVTFSSFGDRGSIDVFCWNEAERAVLIEEIKSEFTAVEGTLRPLGVKQRLAREIAERELGWRPRSVGVVLVLPEGAHVRERVKAHGRTFSSVLPARWPDLRQWLAKPDGDLGAIWFLSLSDVVAATWRTPKRIRVKRRQRPRGSDAVAGEKALRRAEGDGGSYQ